MKAIYKGPDREFVVDDICAVWLCRMCVGEAGMTCTSYHVSAMLWALAHRFLLHPGRKHWSTYLGLARAFSQPINPRWQKGGDLAVKFDGTEMASAQRLHRRFLICNLSRDKIADTIVTAVYKFQSGVLPKPDFFKHMEFDRVSNWGAWKGIENKFPHGVDIDGNWFFQDKRLIDGEVTIEIPSWE